MRIEPTYAASAQGYAADLACIAYARPVQKDLGKSCSCSGAPQKGHTPRNLEMSGSWRLNNVPLYFRYISVIFPLHFRYIVVILPLDLQFSNILSFVVESMKCVCVGVSLDFR